MPSTMIMPIIAFIAIIAKVVFGVEIGESEQAQIAENVGVIIAAGFVLYGIVKNHIKKQKENKA